MKCYKSGGCGVYENRSCYECPASKPEYLKRYEFPDKGLVEKLRLYGSTQHPMGGWVMTAVFLKMCCSKQQIESRC